MKKRYSLTLTQEKMERLKSVLKELGFPPSAVSQMIDDNLDLLADVFEQILERKKAGEQLTFTEMMGMMFGTMSQSMKDK